MRSYSSIASPNATREFQGKLDASYLEARKRRDADEALKPAYGIGTGLKYGAAVWLCIGALTYGLYAAIGVARDYSFDEVARHSEAFSSFRTANGGRP